eukprot:CAMPEP_0202897016 /NCGR_PEP_ID=MMETSP1392-20130828/5895_1 /ASSEMBLY_ACC=CAM_ASM_000868 /TAXON_ID=225041 /ORGANISM="Chlamydomonas chlamydogama, Strain SAG 11-48b" /LENGTH=154 /DNA_ID=CAMNT_0049582559 /DNA_START=243 /DNA_END=708 /DNA_ORIENTATION=-
MRVLTTSAGVDTRDAKNPEHTEAAVWAPTLSPTQPVASTACLAWSYVASSPRLTSAARCTAGDAPRHRPTTPSCRVILTRASAMPWYLGATCLPAATALASACMRTLTRSAGTATAWPTAPAVSPISSLAPTPGCAACAAAHQPAAAAAAGVWL